MVYAIFVTNDPFGTFFLRIMKQSMMFKNQLIILPKFEDRNGVPSSDSMP